MLRLLAGKEVPDLGDPRTAVMPSAGAGPEQVEAFRETVDVHLEKMAKHRRLATKQRQDHPNFGSFNAHQWHCMFGFHLAIHRRQLEAIVRELG